MATEAVAAHRDISSSSKVFIPDTIDEPEINSINFRQSLKFFQEQLTINGNSFPTPTSEIIGRHPGSINGTQNKQDTSETTNRKEPFRKDHPTNKIQIPTVDTILESVRVLRAIQKSQRERNAIWNLNTTSQSNSCLDEHLLESIKNLNNIETRHSFEICEKKQNLNAVITNNSNHADETADANNLTSTNKTCSFWPSNIVPKEELNGKYENINENSNDSVENKSLTSHENMKHQIVLESKNASASNKTGMPRPVLENDCYTKLKESDGLGDVFEKDENNLTSVFNGSIIEDSTDPLQSIENRNFKITDLSHENLKAQYIIAFVTEPSSPNPNCIDMQSNQLASMPKIFLSSYSGDDHNIKKLSSFDGDSGIGTQRSPISSCSATTQHRKDSWSDTCSSLYVSAECSPCPSLSSLFDSSLGFNSYMPSLVTDSLDAEYQENVWEEDAFETQIKDVFTCKNACENKIEKDQRFDSNSSSPIHTLNKELTHAGAVSDHHEGEEMKTLEQSNQAVIVDFNQADVVSNHPETEETKISEQTNPVLIANFHQTGLVSNRETKETKTSEQSNVCDWQDPNIIHNNGERIPKQSEVSNSSSDENYIPSDRHANGLIIPHADESVESHQVATETTTKTLKVQEANDYSANASRSPRIDDTEIFNEQKKHNSLLIESSDNLANKETLAMTKNQNHLNNNICYEQIQKGDIKHPESQETSCNQEAIGHDGTWPAEDEEEKQENSVPSYSSFSSIELKLPRAGSYEERNGCEVNVTNKNSDSSSFETFKSTEESLIIIDDQYATKGKKDISEKFNNENSKTNGADVEIEVRQQKITSASWNVVSVIESLYELMECSTENINSERQDYEQNVFVMSKCAFSIGSEGVYNVSLQNSVLAIKLSKDSEILCSISLIYTDVNIVENNTLLLDNKMGRCLYFRFEEEEEMMRMKEEVELRSFQHWKFECIKLVHYPLKCHQDVVIIDLGSCSTRAGILMDQPTLPTLFFPTICAKDKITGKCVYGMEALQSEVRKNSNLSFPVRTPEKINKHTMDIDVLGGLFEKIFMDLRIDPSKYTVQLCLPRSINTHTQNALMKLLLEDLKVEAVSLTNQALLTLYAHDVSTAVIVDVGNRMDILPVVDGFIVENGVTKLPYGGQRIIHHMKHALASKHLSLSSEIDSFMVQYIMENAAYIAQDFEAEVELSLVTPDVIQKSITLPQFGKDSSMLEISLDDARFKIAEGLFKPELWGLDNPGIHQLVQKAIQATSVDARKRIAESIYVSGGVTMLPGFVERLSKEVSKQSKTKVIPKVFASKYRYYCTFIGACKFANMKEFPQVCVNFDEYSKDHVASLKKFVLCT